MKFQFTPVLRRATRPLRHVRPTRCFNSRPSCDGRPAVPFPRRQNARFNSRPSCDGRPYQRTTTTVNVKFQFTPVLRRATGHGWQLRRGHGWVSIHARLATGDKFCMDNSSEIQGFNSRPSCDGRPRRPADYVVAALVSIHARLATGDVAVDGVLAVLVVSIHARLATGDRDRRWYESHGLFQFTPVLRRATRFRADRTEAAKFQFTPVLRRATGSA